MKQIPFRDVHLDFHTSGLIPDVGADFDPAQFARTLTEAHVGSICVFARCHHGYCYYPTKVGTPHPGLRRRDLLGEMINSLRAVNISPGVYTTVVWDELTSQSHPEWRQVTAERKFIGGEGAGWKWLCMNTPYANWMEAHLREVLSAYSFDRLFVDIVNQWGDGCVCDHCLEDMRENGLDPKSPTDRRIEAMRVRSRFIKRMRDIVNEYNPEVLVYYNRPWPLSAHPEATLRRDLANYGYMIIESLPTGGWGYNHFPLLAHYFMNKGIPVESHTGRFHKSWGDFGGLKSAAALEYECLRVAARGVGCGIGDQLHPRGRLDAPTYKLIGSVYRQIEALEPWLTNTEPVAEIGVVIAAGTGPDGVLESGQSSEEGAMRMLMELGHQFAIVDEWDDLTGFRLLLLPDHVYLSDALGRKLAKFLDDGGKIIASHSSGRALEGGVCPLPGWPSQWLGESRYSINYLRPIANGLGPDVEGYDYVLYEPAASLKALPGATISATVVEPYFDRTAAHFCSHRQTPPDRDTGSPAVLQTDRIIHFAPPIFRAYRNHGNIVYKVLVRNAIDRLLPDPLLSHDLPSTAEVTVRRQGGRHIVHVLHYAPQRRAEIDIVEDALPLTGFRIGIRSIRPPTRAYLIPKEEELPMHYENKYASVTIPVMKGHAHIVFDTS